MRYGPSEEDLQTIERARDIAELHYDDPTLDAAIELHQQIREISRMSFGHSSSRTDDGLWELKKRFKTAIDEYGQTEREQELEDRFDALNEALNDEPDVNQQTEILREQEHVQDELDKANAFRKEELQDLFGETLRLLDKLIAKHGQYI